MKKECVFCSTEFHKTPSNSRAYWEKRRFCSISCATQHQIKTTGPANLGNKFSEDSKRRMSEIKIKAGVRGKNHHLWKSEAKNCAECGAEFEAPPHRSAAKFCSQVCTHKARDFGLTPASERARKSDAYKAWRKAVFERDNYTCQECESRSEAGKPLVIHADHIKPFALHPELRFDVGNGRTLCKPCHQKTPTYGPKSWTKKSKQ